MTNALDARAPWTALLLVACCVAAPAQTAPPAPAEPKAPAAAPAAIPAASAPAANPAAGGAPVPGPAVDDPLAQLAWLDGCWRGSVNQREFREHWMPPRGGMLVGVSQTVMDGKTLDYEYLRIESRPDGVNYVMSPPGKPEIAYRLADVAPQQGGDVVFTFASAGQDFPQKILYRKSTEGWLYATVEGKVGGADRQVIYPMRRIGCESGELIKK
jgi:hypothetical protein